MMNNNTITYLYPNKKIPFEKVAFVCSFFIAIIANLYLVKATVYGSSWLPIEKSSDLTLALIHCIIGCAALFLPKLILKLLAIKLPDMLCVVCYIFIICSTILGEMFSLYYRISFWDDLLHFTSGIMIGMFGAILMVTFLRKMKSNKLITPIVIAVSAVCFALCVGMIWEIYEFSVDSLLGLNMQKFMLQDGTQLIGQSALADTMKDLIIDSVGALVAAISSYHSIKTNKGWLAQYKIESNVKVTPRFDAPIPVLSQSA